MLFCRITVCWWLLRQKMQIRCKACGLVYILSTIHLSMYVEKVFSILQLSKLSRLLSTRGYVLQHTLQFPTVPPHDDGALILCIIVLFLQSTLTGFPSFHLFILFLPNYHLQHTPQLHCMFGTRVFILSELLNIDVTGLILSNVGIRTTCANGVTMRSSACLNQKIFNGKIYYFNMLGIIV